MEVPGAVADAIVEESRTENAGDAMQHYHCYFLDASPGIENHFPEQVISPEDILMEKEMKREQEAAHALTLERLRKSPATLTSLQASYLHARFGEEKQLKKIAEAEGFTTSAAILPDVDVKAFLIALFHLAWATELAAKLPKSRDRQFVRLNPEKRELFEQRRSRELILFDAAARYLKKLKAIGEELNPKDWQRKISLPTSLEQVDSIDIRPCGWN